VGVRRPRDLGLEEIGQGTAACLGCRVIPAGQEVFSFQRVENVELADPLRWVSGDSGERANQPLR
jgi:hypothetical protein